MPAFTNKNQLTALNCRIIMNILLKDIKKDDKKQVRLQDECEECTMMRIGALFAFIVVWFQCSEISPRRWTCIQQPIATFFARLFK